MPKGIF